MSTVSLRSNSLPAWGAAGAGLETPETNDPPEVTLRIEDAEPGITAHFMPGQEVWFVVTLVSSSPDYKNDINVTLDVVDPQFEVTKVGTRTGWNDVVDDWVDPVVLPGGRYQFCRPCQRSGSGSMLRVRHLPAGGRLSGGCHCRSSRGA